jgi:steroid delta-isomerase-like uncharacterized protein
MLGLPRPRMLGSTMTADRDDPEPAAVARRFYDLISAGCIDAAVELALPAFVGHGLGGGRDSLRVELQTWASAFPDLLIHIEDTISEGDRVAVRMRLCGTHAGTFAGVSASGRRFKVRSTAIVRVVDGRIAEAWPLCDLAGLLVQVGARVPH